MYPRHIKFRFNVTKKQIEHLFAKCLFNSSLQLCFSELFLGNAYDFADTQK